MQREPAVFLDDILEACSKIFRYTEGLTLDAFRADDKTVDAVVRNFAIIGEAAGKIPDDIRGAMPEVEWKRMAAMRNVLIHGYFGVDPDILWQVTQLKLPGLRAAIRDYLERHHA